MTYYRVDIFALGSLDGGHWEDALLISGATPDEAYLEALAHLRNKGFAFESKITVCDKYGDNLV